MTFPAVPGQASPGGMQPGNPGGDYQIIGDLDSGQAAEGPPLIGVSDSDTGSFAEAQVVVVATAKSDSDTGHFTDSQSVSIASQPGAGPSFPLIFQMQPISQGATQQDMGTFTEDQFVTAYVRDSDEGVFTEAQNFPGGPPPLVRAEGFSVTHVGILAPGTGAEEGTLYAVQSAQLDPQWVTTLTTADDTVVNSWNAPGSVGLSVAGGFIPYDVLALLFSDTVSSSGIAPADYYSLPLLRQHVTGQFPLVIRANARDAQGHPRVLQFVVYAAQFGPLSFGGPVYKNGLTVTYTAKLVLSSTDEVGNVLPDRAYGRLMFMPPGATEWVPVTSPPAQVVHVYDSDFGQFINETAMASAPGTVHVSSDDSGHFTEGQRVNSGVQQISDSDSGHFTEAQVLGAIHHVSDSDSFAGRDSAGFVSKQPASTRLVAQYIGAVSSPENACPSSVTDWLNHGNPTIGPLATDKIFYSGTQPMTIWSHGHLNSDNESQLPLGTLVFICYKDSQIPQLASYVASIPDNVLVYLNYWQEPEDSYPAGNYSLFIEKTIQCSEIIRSVGKPNVKVFQDSASSKYGVAGSTAQQGLWLVPPQYVDAYTIDIYQIPGDATYPSAGLANYKRWLAWLNVFAGQGRQLAITEYGVAASGGSAVRNARIQADCAYLRTAFPPSGSPSTVVSPFPLLAWNYWWSNCTAGVLATSNTKQHEFTDSATITTWQQIEAGTL